jgi:hypothetical protein
MSPHEDQLIAMGIERFTPFYADCTYRFTNRFELVLTDVLTAVFKGG